MKGGYTIDWEDLAGRPQISYQLAFCPGCGHVLILRLPERTLHRHLEAARKGYQPLTHCPKCGGALYRRNWAN